ncbi:MAG: dephospho-CoA kinase [Alistipes sp.]|nr:dephospho-CoA kinase [Alistipes sp.]
MIKVGLCGTIGSGKSTICRLFEQRGVAVYIADDRAKELMSTDHSLMAQITEAFGAECYQNGVLNRQYLASQIFSDDSKRLLLNSIVHPAVCRHFVQWAESQGGDYVIVESAILFESGLDRVVDRTIAVVVDADVAITRAAARDGATREAIAARMAVQMSSEALSSRVDFVIENNDLEAAERQVAQIDKSLRML